MRFNFSWHDLMYPQPYDFSGSHDLFTDVSRQWFSLFSLYWRSGANTHT